MDRLTKQTKLAHLKAQVATMNRRIAVLEKELATPVPMPPAAGVSGAGEVDKGYVDICGVFSGLRLLILLVGASRSNKAEVVALEMMARRELLSVTKRSPAGGC